MVKMSRRATPRSVPRAVDSSVALNRECVGRMEAIVSEIKCSPCFECLVLECIYRMMGCMLDCAVRIRGFLVE